MVVHVVLLAAGGVVHAFKFSILLWPFNLVLPLLRHLPRVCVTLRIAAAHYDAELGAYLSARRRAPLQPPRSVVLRRLQRWPPGQLVAPAMLALVDISY
ncbi:unnamed protein product [Alopecurus aequalis]